MLRCESSVSLARQRTHLNRLGSDTRLALIQIRSIRIDDRVLCRFLRLLATEPEMRQLRKTREVWEVRHPGLVRLYESLDSMEHRFRCRRLGRARDRGQLVRITRGWGGSSNSHRVALS